MEYNLLILVQSWSNFTLILMIISKCIYNFCGAVTFNFCEFDSMSYRVTANIVTHSFVVYVVT